MLVSLRRSFHSHQQLGAARLSALFEQTRWGDQPDWRTCWGSCVPILHHGSGFIRCNLVSQSWWAHLDDLLAFDQWNSSRRMQKQGMHCTLLHYLWPYGNKYAYQQVSTSCCNGSSMVDTKSPSQTSNIGTCGIVQLADWLEQVVLSVSEMAGCLTPNHLVLACKSIASATNMHHCKIVLIQILWMKSLTQHE